MILNAFYGKGADPVGAAVQITNSCVIATGSILSEEYSFALTKVVDDQGRMIPAGPFQNYIDQMDPAEYKSLIPLDVLPTSKTVEITIGVTTNRFASFVVAPPKFPSAAKK